MHLTATAPAGRQTRKPLLPGPSSERAPLRPWPPWRRHLEAGAGVTFPFSRGCSFYTVNGQGQIVQARDLVEPAIKPGSSTLQVRPAAARGAGGKLPLPQPLLRGVPGAWCRPLAAALACRETVRAGPLDTRVHTAQVLAMVTPLIKLLGPAADPAHLKKLPVAAAAVWLFYAGMLFTSPKIICERVGRLWAWLW
jgi:hypothetical protein